MVNRQKFKIALLLIAVTWLASCVVPQAFIIPSNPSSNPVNHPSNPANPIKRVTIKRVAILPMLNNSNDVDAPTRLREEFLKRLGRYHYDIQPLAKTNETLNHQMGITLGKQFDMATPQEIGKTLGVDGLFYGYLLDFDEITIGLASSKVRMGWKLVDTKTGKIIWGQGVAVQKVQSATLGGLAGLVSNEAEKVNALPGSTDPMNEMPGLNKWISMDDPSVSRVGDRVIVKIIPGKSFQNEIDLAYNHLFSGMLTGSAVK